MRAAVEEESREESREETREKSGAEWGWADAAPRGQGSIAPASASQESGSLESGSPGPVPQKWGKVCGALERAGAELRAALAESEREIGTLAGEFAGLARETGTILEQAGQIVECAESERMHGVLPAVRALRGTATGFLRERLEATAGMLETVRAEAALLSRLAALTRGQRAIVRETEMLRVLTNIEVARLGEVGAGFAYLAQELDDFSQALAKSIAEMADRIEERRAAIGEMLRTLTEELPRTREDYARMEASLGQAAAAVEKNVERLGATPARLRGYVEQIAGQIAGVVAGIQGHDITRQQTEHVEAALRAIAEELGAGELSAGEPGGETPAAARAELGAGRAIQAYQLQSIRETVRGWTGQIRTCLEGMGRIAATEILDLAPAVLAQERELAGQLARFEQMEEACAAENARVQASAAGIAGLMQLVGEHLARSKDVRERLQLLMFNSIVEASHLGGKADGILEISTTIKRISAVWGGITGESEAAMREIAALVEASGERLQVFSAGSGAGLEGAQKETRAGLEALREAAGCADRQGRAIETATAALQGQLAETGGAGERLETCFGRLDRALAEVDSVREELGTGTGCDAEAAERRFGAEYTTEQERAVLRAALTGAPLPVAGESFAGNSVELF